MDSELAFINYFIKKYRLTNCTTLANALRKTNPSKQTLLSLDDAKIDKWANSFAPIEKDIHNLIYQESFRCAIKSLQKEEQFLRNKLCPSESHGQYHYHQHLNSSNQYSSHQQGTYFHVRCCLNDHYLFVLKLQISLLIK